MLLVVLIGVIRGFPQSLMGLNNFWDVRISTLPGLQEALVGGSRFL